MNPKKKLKPGGLAVSLGLPLSQTEMSNGFLDFDFVDWKKCPKWIREGKRQMMKDVGMPCKGYAPWCPACKAWVHFIELASFFSDPYAATE